MVTVLYRQRHGYDVRIFSEDHEPAHVHVFKGGNRVRVFLDPISFDENHGFNDRELRRIRRLIELHLELIRDQWAIVHRSRRTNI
ncbi:MAG: DUF4160 domain-containing protein [Chloroflexi bacterium]|nr:DUF4160 domain-containing protein [Chloroflexota bacterium]